MLATPQPLPEGFTGPRACADRESVSAHVDSDFACLREHMVDCEKCNPWRCGLSDWAERAQSLMVPRMILSVICAGATGLIIGGLASFLNRV
ncbi:hypothetical protein WKW79_36255 [Variovorax robiniae]|uniref:Uncharacterized protein n=1 Tax=Variovorax robiniae TaxID=1836199 RepID=A0ABU8XJJ5_9BURK